MALTGLKFFASLTSTCNEPFDDGEDDDELREPLDDFMLPPNLRKPLLIDDLEKCDDFESGGTNFKPTIMSPRYVERSSNGSLYEMKNIFPKKKKNKKEKNKKEKETKRKKNERKKKKSTSQKRVNTHNKSTILCYAMSYSYFGCKH